MAKTPGPDLEDMLLTLNPFIEGQPEGSKERTVLELAQAALLYIRDRGQEADFATCSARCYLAGGYFWSLR